MAKKPPSTAKVPRKPGNTRGPLPYAPTADQRSQVEMMAAVGVPQSAMAAIIGICIDTLAKHFRDELDLGLHKANAKMAGKLFNKGMAGDTASIIFWLKTRAGFKETSGLELSGDKVINLSFPQAGDDGP